MLGAHGRARKLIDTQFVKIPFFLEGKDYEDWSFAFKRAMRAASGTTYKTLATVQDARWRSAARSWPSSSARKMSRVIPGDLQRVVPVCGRRSPAAGPDGGRLKVSSLDQAVPEVRPKTMARAIRMVGQVTNPPKVKELRDVEQQRL